MTSSKAKYVPAKAFVYLGSGRVDTEQVESCNNGKQSST